jgi:hypothetical protein
VDAFTLVEAVEGIRFFGGEGSNEDFVDIRTPNCETGYNEFKSELMFIANDVK